MKEKFINKNFNARSQAMIFKCEQIIENYEELGLRLTLRQLYYQLVSRDIIPNEEKSYKALSSLISNARLAGMIDWDLIEDRIRQPYRRPEFNNLDELVNAAIRSYRLPRMVGQKWYVELWVEKDALAGVLQPISDKYHITLMVNRGYSSQSAMYESAQRIIARSEEYGCAESVIFYLGDMDPSGEDMVRDIIDRLDTFCVDRLDVVKLALTPEQIKEYNPPPNPAKLTDPRAAGFIARHGNHSWEVDALPPQVLTKLVEEAIEEYIDLPSMQKIARREEKDKRWLKKQIKER